MATVSDLIAGALKEIAVLAAGEAASDADSSDALLTLNRMVNAWKAERIFLYGLTRTTWTITASTQTYNVATGSTVNVDRPEHIDSIKVSDSSTSPAYEFPLYLMNDKEYAEIRIKSQTADRPTSAYYNLQYPTATIFLWPNPTSSTLTGVLYAATVISTFAALSTTVSLPPGYERMIVKNLAVELAPMFGKQPSEYLQRQAQDSLAVVLRANTRLRTMRFGPDAMMQRPVYDIYSDLS